MSLFDGTGAGRLLSDLGGTIFGTPSSTDPSTVWGGQSPYLTDIYEQAQTAAQGPNVTQTGLQGREMALGAAQGMSPFINQAQQSNQFLMNPNMLDPSSNPFLAQTAQAASRPIMQALTEQILPNIRGGAVGAGQFGGSRQGIAEGIAARGALQQIGDTSANIYSQAYGQGLNAMQGGLGMAPQTAALGLMPSQVYQDVGSQQQMDPFRNLSMYSNIVGGPTVLGGGGTGATQGALEQVGSLISAVKQ